MADVGRLLHPEDREKLLAAIPPVYPRVVARHVAPEGGEPPDFPLPGEAEGFVAGVADGGAGVQALVVEIGGTTQRPDGSTYHVTRSLAPGREAVESNDAIRERGWTATPRPPRSPGRDCGADPVPFGLPPRWSRCLAQAVPEVRHARTSQTRAA
jgi:hypothetical protein